MTATHSEVGGPVVSQQGVEGSDADEVLEEVGELEDATEVEEGRAAEDGAAKLNDLELEGDIAADYVEGLLDIADLDGDIDMDVEGDRALVSIVGEGNDRALQRLVGQDGEVLEALQELTRLAVHRETG